MSYRDTLFEQYQSTHVRYLENADALRTAWFEDHLRRNLLRHFPRAQAAPRILEIGCSKGFLLAALRRAGYEDVAGIDRSADDLAVARELFGLEGRVELADAMEFLPAHPGAFDVIVTRAVLEHVPKDDVLPLLESAREALRPEGRLVVEVPNMDWLFAAHERYMDFTHEVGFTRESLGQLLRIVFGNGVVEPAAEAIPYRWRPNLRARLARPIARTVLSLLFSAMGEGAGSLLWHARTIVGVATRETSG